MHLLLVKKISSFLLISAFFITNITYFAPQIKAQETVTNPNELSAMQAEQPKKIPGTKPDLAKIEEQIDRSNTDNTLLVKVKEGSSVTTTKNKIRGEVAVKLSIDAGNIKDYDGNDDQTVAIQFADKKELKAGLKAALKDENVEIAQPNYKYLKQYAPTNDPEWTTNDWYLKDQANSTYTQSGWDALGAKQGVTCGESASGKRCGGEPSVKIAVIDSGVNLAISDFAGAPVDTVNMMRFYNNSGGTACPSGETYTPANGLVVGWQFCQKIGTGTTQQFDEDGHGTAVSSLIMAQDNGVGSVGIAHNTTLLPIALHNDTFNTFFIAEAIKYAQIKGAKVINLSLGTPYYDSYLESAINQVTAQGVVIVAASGNCAVFTISSCDWDGSGTQNQPEEANNAIMYPAGFTNVIAVGASNSNGTRSCYSNYGAHLDIVAPVGDSGTSCGGTATPSGVRIACGVVSGSCSSVGIYRSGAGTSYAAPQVVAAVGLLMSADPILNLGQIQGLFKSGNLTDLGASGRDDQFGNGLLNVNNLLQVVAANYVPTHYFPWYGTNGQNRSWTLVGNPSTTTSVKVKLELTGTNYLRYATLAPGQSIFHESLGILGGPIKVSSENGANLYATQRTHMEINGNYSFNEYPGISPTSFSNTFYFPWYGTNGQNRSWTLVGNPSTTTSANVTIKFNGSTIRTATIAPGASIFHETLGLLGGPIVVTSDIPIYSTQRTHMEINGNYSFNEYLGITP
jgi:Subtilase family